LRACVLGTSVAIAMSCQAKLAGLASDDPTLIDALCAHIATSVSGVSDSLTEVNGTLGETALRAEEIAASLDGSWMLANAYLVFFMQAGFAMLCAGSVRSKNCMNILLKNVLDACFGAPIFFLFGYGFAYGVGDKEDNGFIGNNNFALDNHRAYIAEGADSWNGFLFQWAFAAATATIVSGSVAERCSFQAYIAYSVFLTGFVYPVVVHWIWASNGWLSAFHSEPLMDSGMIDFAGSGVVHMTGGFAGLVGASVIGPRTGRFDSTGAPNPNFGGHSMTMVVLGTFCLWFGWYGFNPGSMLACSSAAAINVVGRSAVTTTLSAASGGVTALFVNKLTTGHYDLAQVCNGLLAGLVGITAGCSVVEPAAAILCGFVAAFIFEGGCQLLLKLKIDDPLAASPMHGFCGAWGVIYVGLMAKEEYVLEAYSDVNKGYGAFYGGGGELLGCQVTGVVCIIAWVCGLLGPFFFALKAAGQLRVPMEEEEMGLDVSHHGGDAYTFDDKGKP